MRRPPRPDRGASARCSETIDLLDDVEILVDEENAPPTPTDLGAVALPRLPTSLQLQKRFFERSPKRAERYIRDDLRPRIARTFAVGDEATRNVVEIMAHIDDLLTASPGPRADTILVYLGVKPTAAKRLNALFHSLLPPAGPNAGADERKNVSNRHSRYARAIEGARRLGIPTDGLADALRRLGIERLAKAAVERTTPDGTGGGVQVAGLDTSTVEDDGDERGEAEPVRQAIAALSKRPVVMSGPDERSETVQLMASPEDAKRMASRTDIVLCLVDRQPEVPELVAGIPMPEDLRHDEAAAAAWVRAAITAAAESSRAKPRSTRRGGR